MAAPSYDTVHIAFNTMLATLDISTDDTTILNESQNPLIWQSEYVKEDFIQKIDGVVEVLSSLSCNIVNILSTRIANIGKCRNAIVPRIHHLPNEIFDNIIAQSSHRVYPPYKQEWSLQRLTTLRGVSTSWNQRMIANGSLWATIDDKGISCRGDPWRTLGRMGRLLELSGSVPIQIKLSCLLPEEVVATMIPHLDRLKHLEILRTCTGGQSLFKHPMPLLESLLLDALPDRRPEILQEFMTYAKAPRLRALKIPYSSLLPSLDTSIVSNLEHLELALVTVPDLRANLAVCTRLKSLVINYSYSTDLPEAITMPYLKTLHLRSNSGAPTAILNAIEAPRCRSFKFDGHSCYEWLSWQTNILLATAFRPLASGRGITVTVEKRIGEEDYDTLDIRSYDRVDLPTLSFRKDGPQVLLFLAGCKGGWIPHVVRLEVSEVDISGLKARRDFEDKMQNINVEEIGLFPSPDSTYRGMELWKAVVKARRGHPGPLSSRTSPLRRLDVWNGYRWIDKLDEIEAAMGLKDDGMVVD